MDASDPRSRPRCSTPGPRSWRACPSPTARPTSPATSRPWSSSPRSAGVPIGGKDFKTGQTMVKTVLAPMFKARMLGVAGLVLDQHSGQPGRRGAGRSRRASRPRRSRSSACWSTSSSRKLYPELYGNIFHKVRINYYPPRGDNKEGWDNIDIFGWLGYPMQIKVDFLCRDSILAAPLVLDLALFFDLAQRAGLSGIQEWLSFYFKSPQVAPGPLPRARPLHPADQAQEHAALPDGGGADHPPRASSITRNVSRSHEILPPHPPRRPTQVLARRRRVFRRHAGSGGGAAPAPAVRRRHRAGSA